MTDVWACNGAWGDAARGAALFLLLSAGAACIPPQTGECDESAARSVVYADDALGQPAYAGQALINRSCGAGAFCHSEGASDRLGAPFGMDFDLSLASDAESSERLRRAQAEVHRLGRWVLLEVQQETMPPGEVGAGVEAAGPQYRDLPALHSPEGEETLRNWLACGSPVVERTSADRPAGVAPVGAIVAARPTVPPGGCTGGLTDCAGTCVDLVTNPDNCGACATVCEAAEFCAAGACTSECPGGTTECSRACVDTQSDPNHCGGCDVVCGAGRACDAGSCACAPGFTACGAECVDVDSSSAHCGACDNACRAGSSCEGGACMACGESVRYAAHIEPGFVTCAAGMCHSGARPAGELDLGPGRAYSGLVGVASTCGGSRLLVEPGAPDRSYLVDKLRGRALCRGQQMPLRAAPLPEAEIAQIEDWICGGARND